VVVVVVVVVVAVVATVVFQQYKFIVKYVYDICIPFLVMKGLEKLATRTKSKYVE